MTPSKMDKAALVQEVFALRDTNKAYRLENKRLTRTLEDKVAMVARDRDLQVVTFQEQAIDYKKKYQEARKQQGVVRRGHIHYVEKVRSEIDGLKKQVGELNKSIAYFTKNHDWENDTSRAVHVEVILRAIVTYDRLIKDGMITFNELAVLLVGTQKEVFGLDDIKARFPVHGFWKSQFFACVEAGLFKRMHRKALWHITQKGKQRFNDIMKYIYEAKVGTYSVFRKDMVEE